MIICPLEATVIFGGCPVGTCMWNNKTNGSCSAGSKEFNSDSFNRELVDCSDEEVAAVAKVKTYVTVGLFLEERLGDLIAIANGKGPSSLAVPPAKDFAAWAKVKAKAGSTNRLSDEAYLEASLSIIRGLRPDPQSKRQTNFSEVD